MIGTPETTSTVAAENTFAGRINEAHAYVLGRNRAAWRKAGLKSEKAVCTNEARKKDFRHRPVPVWGKPRLGDQGSVWTEPHLDLLMPRGAVSQ